LLPVTSTQPRDWYTQPGPLVRPPGPTVVSALRAGAPVLDAPGQPVVLTVGAVPTLGLGDDDGDGDGDGLALTVLVLVGEGLGDGLGLGRPR
jgi:hypothetical protein